MGLLSGIGAGLNAASQAAIGQQKGELEGSALMRAIQMQQYQIAKEQAETNLATQHARVFTNTANQPQPGTPEYYDNLRRSAQATGEGGMQPKIDTAVGIAKGTAPVEVGKAVDIAKGTTPIKTAGAIATAAGIAPIEERKAVNIATQTAPIHTAEAIATAKGVAPIKTQELRDANSIKPLTSDEVSATTHLPLMANAAKNMNNLPGPSARQQMASQGGFWRNYLNTPAGRQWSQAAQQAALSGALATEGPRGAQKDRVAMVQKTYVPMPGDDDATAEQKLQAFHGLLQAAKVKAGRGYDRIAPDQRQMIDGVLNGGGSPSAPATGADPFAHLTPSKP